MCQGHRQVEGSPTRRCRGGRISGPDAEAARPPFCWLPLPAELISHAVWLYFRFPLSLRMVEEMLAARGVAVTYETIRQWGLKFGREFANRIRRGTVQRLGGCVRIS